MREAITKNGVKSGTAVVFCPHNGRDYHYCTFEEISSYLKEDSHVVVINRGTWVSLICDDREHFEVGFRAMSLPVDYFLFIQIDSDKMPPVLEKYRLDSVSKGI